MGDRPVERPLCGAKHKKLYTSVKERDLSTLPPALKRQELVHDQITRPLVVRSHAALDNMAAAIHEDSSLRDVTVSLGVQFTIFRGGGSQHLRNFDTYTIIQTASHPGRLEFSPSPSCGKPTSRTQNTHMPRLIFPNCLGYVRFTTHQLLPAVLIAVKSVRVRLVHTCNVNA